MKYRKLSKLEKKEDRQKRLQELLKGEGMYLYENTTNATLFLPKPAANGCTRIEPNKRFQGDSYFKSMVGKGLRIIEVIVPPPERTNMPEQKLILDQPDQITDKGRVEHVVVQPQLPLNENQPKNDTPPKDILINEDPMDGVEIILG